MEDSISYYRRIRKLVGKEYYIFIKPTDENRRLLLELNDPFIIIKEYPNMDLSPYCRKINIK